MNFMETLNELVYYCNEEIPNGALLLTGDWGCGKTYLIDHDFRNEIKDKALLIRVSLFGIREISEVDAQVRNEFIQLYLQETSAGLQTENVKRIGSVVKQIAEKMKDSSSFVSGAYSLSELIPLKTEINGKKVIIIFDDLERFQGDTTDVLGLINKYCENKGFHVIIVMHEEAFVDNSQERLSFSKIREKIIKRTVYVKVNYRTVLHNIINLHKPQQNEYKDFLLTNLNALISILGIQSENNDPKALINLRSVKSAMIDFERIYSQAIRLDAISTDTVGKIFCNFVCAVILQKSGKSWNSDDEFAKYPFGNKKYIPHAAMDWVEKGKYDENLIQKQIEEILEWEKEKEPCNIILLNDLYNLDDNILREGFPNYLNMFYSGQCDLKSYVDIIEKSKQARQLEISLPETINWRLVEEGLDKCSYQPVSNFSQELQFENWLHEMKISSKNYSQEEKTLIFKIRKKYYAEKNSNANEKYAQIMSKDIDELIQTLPSLSVNLFRFDEEMAKDTIAAFVRCSNRYKSHFMRSFYDFLGSNLKNIMEFRNQSNFLQKMIEEIENEIECEYEKQNSITVFHLKEFKKQLLEKYATYDIF